MLENLQKIVNYFYRHWFIFYHVFCIIRIVFMEVISSISLCQQIWKHCYLSQQISNKTLEIYDSLYCALCSHSSFDIICAKFSCRRRHDTKKNICKEIRKLLFLFHVDHRWIELGNNTWPPLVLTWSFFVFCFFIIYLYNNTVNTMSLSHCPLDKINNRHLPICFFVPLCLLSTALNIVMIILISLKKLSQIYVCWNNTVFSFACFWTLQKSIELYTSFQHFSSLTNSKILRSIHVVVWA